MSSPAQATWATSGSPVYVVTPSPLTLVTSVLSGPTRTISSPQATPERNVSSVDGSFGIIGVLTPPESICVRIPPSRTTNGPISTGSDPLPPPGSAGWPKSAGGRDPLQRRGVRRGSAPEQGARPRTWFFAARTSNLHIPETIPTADPRTALVARPAPLRSRVPLSPYQRFRQGSRGPSGRSRTRPPRI
jgi:hypothetical protein